MSKNKLLSIYLFGNILYGIVLYYALFQNVNSAMNLIVFYTCIMFLVSVALNVLPNYQSLKGEIQWVLQIDMMFDIVAIALLSFFGHWIIASLIAITALLTNCAFSTKLERN